MVMSLVIGLVVRRSLLCTDTPMVVYKVHIHPRMTFIKQNVAFNDSNIYKNQQIKYLYPLLVQPQKVRQNPRRKVYIPRLFSRHL